jgi:hypothetical protein
MELTIESLFQVLAEEQRQRIESQKAFEAQSARERAEREERQRAYDEQLAKERAEREEQLAKERTEREAQMAAYAAQREIDRKENDRLMKEVNRKVAGISDALGLYAEAQTKERVREMFLARGIFLTELALHYEAQDKNGDFLYEIDILLYNTDYVIVVEVKHHLRKDDVDGHLERMEKCALHPPKGTSGKQLLGCIATMIVSPEVERYALKQGLYLIKPSGESIQFANPMGFVHREWHAQV